MHATSSNPKSAFISCNLKILVISRKPKLKRIALNTSSLGHRQAPLSPTRREHLMFNRTGWHNASQKKRQATNTCQVADGRFRDPPAITFCDSFASIINLWGWPTRCTLWHKYCHSWLKEIFDASDATAPSPPWLAARCLDLYPLLLKQFRSRRAAHGPVDRDRKCEGLLSFHS